MKLVERSSNIFSQFGEDGCIGHIFDVIGVETEVAVEFGAGDGLSCSNTAHLWHDKNWQALLVEGDPSRFALLQSNIAGYKKVTLEHVMVTATGPTSIDALIDKHAIPVPDLLSIDIDGDDYLMVEALRLRARVLCVEFNPTIPPHIDMRQTEPGSNFGASLLSIIRSAGPVGYDFIGATYCNAFFVQGHDAAKFVDYERDPNVLFPPEHYTYAVTDYAGRLTLVGQILPWQAKDPMVAPVEASMYITPPTTDTEYICRAFERLHGPAVVLSATGLSPEELARTLQQEQPPLVCVDLEFGSLSAIDWMRAGLAATNYRTQQIGKVLAFVRNT